MIHAMEHALSHMVVFVLALVILGYAIFSSVFVALGAVRKDGLFYDRIQKLLGRSDVFFGDVIYMSRWRILDFKSFGLRVHKICRSDIDYELHDHPFSFVSIILSGGYIEETPDGIRRFYGRGHIIFRQAEALHRLELAGRPAWTLVFRGPRRRQWGFLIDRHWMHWGTFCDNKEALEAQNKGTRKYAADSSL